MGVMEEAIEQGGHRSGVAQELAPVLDGAIGREEGGGPFVAAHDDLEEILGGGVRELAHAEVVDDQEGDVGELLDKLLSGAGELCVSQLIE